MCRCRLAISLAGHALRRLSRTGAISIIIEMSEVPGMKTADAELRNRLNISALLRPHYLTMATGVLVVAGGSVADLLQPWPIKLVIDTVLKGQAAKGWA